MRTSVEARLRFVHGWWPLSPDWSHKEFAARQAAAVAVAAVHGRNAAIALLDELRREALRRGDRKAAATCIARQWSLSLMRPRVNLQYAKRWCRLEPSEASFVSLGHSYLLSNRVPAARAAYARAIELAKATPLGERRMAMVIAKEAAHAIECIEAARPVPFVEAAERLRQRVKRR